MEHHPAPERFILHSTKRIQTEKLQETIMQCQEDMTSGEYQDDYSNSKHYK